MENAVFANGFEDHIEGAEGLSSKITSSGDTNPDFIL